MTTTHAFVGAGLGLAAAAFGPELAASTLVVGAVGGALPDADLVAVHRRSLHFPVGYAVLSVLACGLALAVPSPATILLAVFLGAAALHCAMDVFGGGVEARPWEMTSHRGVYNHLTGRWIRPRRWVRYAGAPEDLLLAGAAGLPLVVLTTGHVRYAAGLLLACSAAFTVYRRRLARLSERFVDG